MKTYKLKKCPFCGGRATVERHLVGSANEVYFISSCNSENCTAQQSAKTPQKSCEMWNRRTP